MEFPNVKNLNATFAEDVGLLVTWEPPDQIQGYIPIFYRIVIQGKKESKGPALLHTYMTETTPASSLDNLEFRRIEDPRPAPRFSIPAWNKDDHRINPRPRLFICAPIAQHFADHGFEISVQTEFIPDGYHASTSTELKFDPYNALRNSSLTAHS